MMIHLKVPPGCLYLYINIILLILLKLSLHLHLSLALDVYRASNLVPPDSQLGRKFYTSCKIGDGVIASPLTAREYEGCSKILGNLIINAKDEKLLTELYRGLKDVQIITGCLQVSHSPVLSSLDFFPALKSIEGQVTCQNVTQNNSYNYSLVVFHNSNLRSLFPRQNVNIAKGKVSFYSNPKLCTFEINDLKNYANESNWNGEDVNPFSNGDQIKCHQFNFNVKIKHIKSNGKNVTTFVTWNKLTDESLTSCRLYTLYYRKIGHPGQRLNIPWSTLEVTEVLVEMSAMIHCLEHGSQYSVYIKTETFDPDSRAQSEIITFTAGDPEVGIRTSRKLDPMDFVSSDYIKT